VKAPDYRVVIIGLLVGLVLGLIFGKVGLGIAFGFFGGVALSLFLPTTPRS
jgi:hypothetical protein